MNNRSDSNQNDIPELQSDGLIGTEKPFVQITDWQIVEAGKNKYLLGIPLNHPNPNGTVSNTRMVRTSAIIDMNLNEGWVETRNTNYILMGEGLENHG